MCKRMPGNGPADLPQKPRRRRRRTLPLRGVGRPPYAKKPAGQPAGR